MLKIQNKEVSPDLKAERHERDALLGEKNTLQAEMLSLGEVNKRVKKEIKTLKEENEQLETEKRALKGFIDTANRLKIEKEQEIKDLDKVYADKKRTLEISLPNVKQALSDLELKKLPIQTEIDKLASAKELSKKELAVIEEKIKDAKSVLVGLDTSVGHKHLRESLLNASIGKKEKELEKLEERVSKNEAIVSGIEKRQVVLSKINQDITDAELKLINLKGEQKKSLFSENEELKKEIENNKVVNEQEKALHISLLEKQQILDNKEAFIKSQYIRAGLRY